MTRDTHQATYSRTRLLLIAAGWLVAATVAAAMAPGFGAVADDRGCDSAPCAVPAENNVGGIIMATSRLQGQNLVTFGFDGGEYYEEIPPNRAESVERHIGVGISDISTPNMIIYKFWYYYDDRVDADVPVYIWANATSATVSGSSQCGDGSSGWDGAKTCDLLANTSEIYTGQLTATTDCSGAVCSVVPGELTIEDFWAVRPEDDTCGDLEALSSPCLAAISDGGTCVAGTCVETDDVDGQDVYLRGHNFEAVRGPNGDDKEMTVDGLYLEMRYGKGANRAYTPSGSYTAAWGQPITTADGEAALSAAGTCDGGGPNTNCDIPPGRASDIPGMSYDNVHGG